MIWRLEYCNKYGDTARLDIQRGASTPIEVIEGADNPFSLKYKLDASNKTGYFMSSSAEISIFETATFNIDELKTSNETELKVNYYVNSDLKWTGFILPDFFSRVIGEPAIVEMTATDRLGTLKGVTLTGLTAKVTLRSLLEQSLLKTGISLPVQYDAQISESGTNVFDTEILSQRIVDTRGRNISCYDIIKSILVATNSTIRQRDGKWQIYNKLEHESVAPSITFNEVEKGARRTIQPVASSVGIFQELGGGQIYPDNYNFINGLSDWALGGSSPSFVPENRNVMGYTTGGMPIYGDSGFFSIRGYNSADPVLVTPETNPHIKSNPITIQTNDAASVKVNVDVNATGQNIATNIFTVIVFAEKVGEKLAIDQSGVFTKYSSDINKVGQFYHNVVIYDKGKKNIDAVTVNKQISGVLTADNVNDYKITVLITGTWLSAKTVFINSVATTFSSTVDTTKGNIFKTNQGVNFTREHEIDTTIFGDYIARGINGYFYKYMPDDTSSLMLTDGSFTDLWTAFGSSEQLPLLQHMTRQKSKMFSIAHDILSATIEAQSFDPLAIYQSCDGEKWVIIEANYDFLRSNVDVVLEQIKYGALEKRDFIYSYFGDGESGVKSIGGISSGTGGGGSGGGMTAEQIEILNNLSSWWKLDDDGNLFTELNVYSEKEVSAYGVGSGSSSGGGVDLLQAWTDYDSAKDNWAVKAGLLVPFYNDMQSRVGALEAGGGGGGSTVTWGTESGGYVPLTVESVSKSVALSTHTHSQYALTTHNHSGVYEPAFTKNTAFNKDFGTTSGTVAEGNDSRIINGQTAYGWGNHSSAGYALNTALTAHINKVDNPHSVTKAQVGLSNVLNVASYSKTESDAALALKLNKSIFDDLFEKVEISTGVFAIKAKYNFYGVGEISAYGLGTGGSGGGSYDRLDAWADYNSTKAGWVLSAFLGNELNSRVTNLESGSALTVNTTGTGNAITSISKAGTVITATKGATFSLSNHLHTGVYEPVFTKNTAFNKNFGTTAGTVAEGNHTHNYLSLSGGDIKRTFAGWPNAIDSNASNYINQRIFGVSTNQNTLSFFGDGNQNARRFGIQSGHESPVYASAFGILELNPFGGVVRINGITAATVNSNVASATKLQTARTIAGVSFDGTANIAIPFANLSSKPTTLGGYGITDAVTLDTTQEITAQKTFSDGDAVYGITQKPSIILGANDATKAGALKFWGNTVGAYGLMHMTTSAFMMNSSRGNLYLQNWSAGNVYAVTGGGLMGVGTNLPDEKLDVLGNIRLSGGEAGRYVSIYNSGVFSFTAGTGGWASALSYNLSDNTALGSAAGAYGSATALTYFFYGGTYNSPSMVILPNGRVGIGLTTPGYNLGVAGTIGSTSNITAGGNFIITPSTASGDALQYGSNVVLRFNQTNNATVLSVPTSGIVYLRPNGNTSTAGQLTVGADGAVNANGELLVTGGLRVNQTSYNGIGISLRGTHSAVNPTYGLMFASIAAKGSHGAVTGAYATYFTMDTVAGRGWIFTNNAGGSTGNVASISNSGNITASGEITAYVASDRRLKHNITPLFSSLDIIDRLNPVSYYWNQKAKELNPMKSDGLDYGLIAQEVENVLPGVVHGIFDDKYKSIDYIKLIPIMIAAIKELKQKVNKL